MNVLARHRITCLAMVWFALILARPLSSQNTCQAEVFTPDAVPHNPSVFSPDKKYSAVLGGYKNPEEYSGGWLRLFYGKKLRGQVLLPDLSAGMFIKWAPDSRAFYLMWSDGGWLGEYHVRVYQIRERGMRETRATKFAVYDFHRHHSCAERGDNIYAVRWIKSTELLIATEIYPTSDCGQQMGIIRGYAVDIATGRIMQRYSGNEIKNEMRTCPSTIWPSSAWEQSDIERVKAGSSKKEN